MDWGHDHGPLRDLVVLDLTIARAGPTAVRYLADWGARVRRIEPPDHAGQLLADHESSDYLNLHRSKGLIQLDLRDRDLLADSRLFYEGNFAQVRAGYFGFLLAHAGRCG
jgi:crotonobetainyl-CoA:carnitine CoA-transferase CaiB-like acyl-CoA transferase